MTTEIYKFMVSGGVVAIILLMIWFAVEFQEHD